MPMEGEDPPAEAPPAEEAPAEETPAEADAGAPAEDKPEGEAPAEVEGPPAEGEDGACLRSGNAFLDYQRKGSGVWDVVVRRAEQQQVFLFGCQCSDGHGGGGVARHGFQKDRTPDLGRLHGISYQKPVLIRSDADDVFT